jgi:Tfp pilus assembly protein PilN
MIQFNLLPDVKIKYIKARSQKRLVILCSAVLGVASLAVLSLSIMYTYGVQGAQLSSLNKKIKASTSSITQKNKQVDDIGKVLTVQNQLVSLDSLHASKPIMGHIFDYLAKLTPSQVTISTLSVENNTVHTISVQGSTDTLETINKFVDTLKFTTFKTDKDAAEQQIFTGVSLSSFGRDKSGASYSILLTYDPIIFDNKYTVSNLIVPNNKITTRSELGRPVLQSEEEKASGAPAPSGATKP